MSSLHDIMDRAKEFAMANLQECAAELVEWRDTALLRNGKVRELARIFEAVDATHALTLAEREVQHAALEQASRASMTERGAVIEECCAAIRRCENSCPDSEFRIGADYIAAVRALTPPTESTGEPTL
jgi:hypothetical protein